LTVERERFATATNWPPGEGSPFWSSTAMILGPVRGWEANAPAARTAAPTTAKPTSQLVDS
jgi:hypothetical protein